MFSFNPLEVAQPTGFPVGTTRRLLIVFHLAVRNLHPFDQSAGTDAVAAELLAHLGSEAGTKADIRIRVRTGVVQVQVPETSIAGIVPITATNRQALTI
jgi:hypothetical protein